MHRVVPRRDLLSQANLGAQIPFLFLVSTDFERAFVDENWFRFVVNEGNVTEIRFTLHSEDCTKRTLILSGWSSRS